MRAVKAYIASGYQANKTIQELGYPSHEALRGWYREYQKSGDLHRDFIRAPLHTQEQKEKAVAHYYANGCNYTKTSILAFHETTGTTEPLAVLPLSIADDCCNLMLETPPLMLIRSGHNNRIQLLWPERRDFVVEENEYFAFLEGNRLYTSVWYEDPDYREEVLVRDYDTGELLERIPGSLRQMPDGQRWLLV